jgi:hypothetical protein
VAVVPIKDKNAKNMAKSTLNGSASFVATFQVGIAGAIHIFVSHVTRSKWLVIT